MAITIIQYINKKIRRIIDEFSKDYLFKLNKTYSIKNKLDIDSFLLVYMNVTTKSILDFG